MKYTDKKVEKKQRRFFDQDFKITEWKQLEKLYDEILEHEIESDKDLLELMRKFTELGEIISEEMAWLYIDMTRYADDVSKRDKFNEFYSGIVSNAKKYTHEFEKKFYNSPYREKLPGEDYDHLNRMITNNIEIFCEKNISLQVKEQELANLYGEIMSKMTVEYDGEEMTIQKLGIYQKDTDRDVREETYRLRGNRINEEAERLNHLFDELLHVRMKIAQNAGFDNYRDYMHKAKGRFDYTPEDLYTFHDAIETEVLPFLKELTAKRAEKLQIDEVRPWDKAVDLDGKKLQPFETIDEFVSKGIETLHIIDPQFGEELEKMKNSGFLDLDNRMGKSPGGYCMQLAEHNSSFIFMNAVGLQRDLVTLVHESGHTMHNLLSKDIDIAHYNDVPSEAAELASMAMEYISMKHWDIYYEDSELLTKAVREQLEGSLSFLPWCMIVDAFQHWIYTHPDHNTSEREQFFAYLMDRFNPDVVWDGLDDFKKHRWLNQLHIFEVPFYYIEYGISQLGALAVYRNYKKDPEMAIKKYKEFLKLAYSKPLPELYEAAGIELDFSADYIHGIVEFVKDELDKLDD